jgi:hypothetical protein
MSFFLDNKLTHPAIMFIIFLTVADKDIEVAAPDYACHNLKALTHNHLSCAYTLNKIKQLMLMRTLF